MLEGQKDRKLWANKAQRAKNKNPKSQGGKEFLGRVSITVNPSTPATEILRALKAFTDGSGSQDAFSEHSSLNAMFLRC